VQDHLNGQHALQSMVKFDTHTYSNGDSSVQRYNQHHVIDTKSKPVYKQLKRTSADVRHRCVQLQSADQLSTVEYVQCF
jgi:hypothetical protein